MKKIFENFFVNKKICNFQKSKKYRYIIIDLYIFMIIFVTIYDCEILLKINFP